MADNTSDLVRQRQQSSDVTTGHLLFEETTSSISQRSASTSLFSQDVSSSLGLSATVNVEQDAGIFPSGFKKVTQSLVTVPHETIITSLPQELT